MRHTPAAMEHGGGGVLLIDDDKVRIATNNQEIKLKFQVGSSMIVMRLKRPLLWRRRR